MRPKILLIDDNHDTLDIMELFLYNQYDITTAINGFEGLKKAEEEKPDLIITDIMMPIMDGIRFFNNMKRSVEISHIPVIATTSFIRKLTRNSLMNMGFNGVLSKPLDKKELLDIIDAALGGVHTIDNPNTDHESDEANK